MLEKNIKELSSANAGETQDNFGNNAQNQTMGVDENQITKSEKPIIKPKRRAKASSLGKEIYSGGEFSFSKYFECGFRKSPRSAPCVTRLV